MAKQWDLTWWSRAVVGSACSSLLSREQPTSWLGLVCGRFPWPKYRRCWSAGAVGHSYRAAAAAAASVERNSHRGKASAEERPRVDYVY